MRRLLVCTAVIAITTAGLMARDNRAPRPNAAQAQAAPAEPQTTAPAESQTTAPADQDTWMPTEVKNLTVLPKETSPADVMKIMKAWNAALNVQCVFCHVGQVGKPLATVDFVSDNKKRKDVSRVMVKAVMQANETFKTGIEDDPPQLQCSTCHKRSRHVDDDLPATAPSGEHK